MQSLSTCTVIRALEGYKKRAHCVVVKSGWNTTGAEHDRRICVLMRRYLNFKTRSFYTALPQAPENKKKKKTATKGSTFD